MYNKNFRCIPLLFFLFSLVLLPAVQASYAPPMNFHEVDSAIWRSGQPVCDEYRYLEEHGCKAIVNLRLEYDGDRSLITSLGMKYLRIPIEDDTPPTISQMEDIINYVKTTHPALVHCASGRGRTGTVVACYRISIYNWTAQEAIDEAIQYGMKPSDAQSQIDFIEKWETYWKNAHPNQDHGDHNVVPTEDLFADAVVFISTYRFVFLIIVSSCLLIIIYLKSGFCGRVKRLRRRNR